MKYSFFLTIIDLLGERVEPYRTREQAERAMKVLIGQGAKVVLSLNP
jgi:hypothetical protein